MIALRLAVVVAALFVTRATVAQERIDPKNARAVADNLLRLQNEDGGWPKNVDRLEPSAGNRGPSTLDNRSTYPDIKTLLRAYAETADERYLRGAEHGIRYVLREQRPSGGWRGSDTEAITFNDGVMVGVLRLLDAITAADGIYAAVDGDMREACEAAAVRGLATLLACQVETHGVKTGWAQQHDHETLEPIGARTFEPAALAASESAGVLRYLMERPEPSREVILAVESAAAWLEAAAMRGVRKVETPINAVAYEYHTATVDPQLVPDTDTPPLWARYYSLDEPTRPVWTDRDGTRKPSYNEISHERRTGYAYVGTWPRTPLSRLEAWQKRRKTAGPRDQDG